LPDVNPLDPERFRLYVDPAKPDTPESQNSQQQRPKRPSAEHMRRLPMLFVRVPVSWFTGDDPRPCPFEGPRGRLFLLLLHLSRWGQRPVILTTTVAEQIGLSRAVRWKHLRQLERDRWVAIERNGNKAVVVRPIVLAG
jgi:hypothetical protein